MDETFDEFIEIFLIVFIELAFALRHSQFFLMELLMHFRK